MARRLKPEDAALILDHVVGDPSIPAAVLGVLLAGLPTPSYETPRLVRGHALRHLAADPVSESSLLALRLLASLPASSSAASSSIAAARIAVAAFLEIPSPDLRAAAEERIRDLLAAEWAAIEPSIILKAAERIVGDGALETWRAADEPTRAKLRILVGEEKAREILARLEEPTSSANPISTPAVQKVIDALKKSSADLNSVVEDPLPAAKAAADEVVAARMEKRVSLNAEQARGQPTTWGVAGLSTANDKDQGPSGSNLMDRPSQWQDSLDPEGSESSLSPRRLPEHPLPPPENKSNRRKARKWNLLEEETLRKGVEQRGNSWKRILKDYPDVLIGRTAVDLKDKWRNMNPFGPH